MKVFSPSHTSQEAAKSLLKAHKLDVQSLNMLESKWSIATSRYWSNKEKTKKTFRTVYQWYLRRAYCIYCIIISIKCLRIQYYCETAGQESCFIGCFIC